MGVFGRNWSANLAPLSAGGLGVVLGEGGGDVGRDDPPSALGGVDENIAHEVDAGAVEKTAVDFEVDACRARAVLLNGNSLGSTDAPSGLRAGLTAKKMR